MKAKTLGAIVLSSVLGLVSPDAKAEQLPFYEPETNTFTEFWEHGGEKIGWNGGAESAWTYNHNPLNNGNGIELRVSGPASGNSYGAEAWVKTTRNFNDGKEWIINFTWQANRFESHNVGVAIQITDGYIDPAGTIYWESRNIPGTTALINGRDLGISSSEYYISYPDEAGLFPENPANWSININPNGNVQVYDQFNLQGNLLSSRSIDTNFPWYFRILSKDGTSAGFSAGNLIVNVSNVSANQIPEPGTGVLLAGAGIAAAAGYLALKKKRI